MSRRRCPHCVHPLLHPAAYRGEEIDFCRHCGGLFFDRRELTKVLRKSHPDHHETDILPNLGPSYAQSSLRCPADGTAFGVHKLSREVDLDVELCPSCQGIWLEKAQFNKIRAIPQALATWDAQEGGETKRNAWLFQLLTALPVEFNIAPKHTPWVTYGLLLLNIVIFFYQMGIQGAEFTERFALHTGGALNILWMMELFTSQFLHGSLWHLAGNLYFLYTLGDNVEDAMGKSHYLGFYLVCGVAAGVLQTLMAPLDIRVLGASGAIAGVMAAYMILYRRARLTFMLLFVQFPVPASVFFAFWISFNVLSALQGVGNVAWWAHIGGFVAGLLFTWIGYPWLMSRNPSLALLNSGALLRRR